MRGLSASELLAAWERGLRRPASGRALVLLEAAGAEPEREPSVGRRDAALLALHELTFGPRLAALAGCPACGEQLELELTAPELRVEEPSPAELSVRVRGRRVRFRLPAASDLEAVAGEPDVEAARLALLERCLLDGSAAAELDALAVARIAARMAAADPQADVRLALACPACGHAWEAGLDVPAFVWANVQTWAVRLAHEVHALASAYGWSEAEILALSPERRRLYVELAA